MRLDGLIEGLAVRVARGDPAAVRVCDLTEDSRTAVPGSLFVARRGVKTDGRAYVGQAVEAGAVAVLTDEEAVAGDVPGDATVLLGEDLPGLFAELSERAYGRPSSSLYLIGVTGTNGKTTVAHLVHQLLNRAGVRCGLIGTVEVDDGTGPAEACMTTPPAAELSRTLSVMVESGCRAAVMEASSHALDQRRCDGLAFDSVIFTNLSGDHLDYHGDMACYEAAKRRLFELHAQNMERRGPAIVNAEDEASGRMAEASEEIGWCWIEDKGEENPAPSPVPPSGKAGRAWRCRVQGAGLTGSRLEIVGPGVSVAGSTPLIGRHNAMNVLQACAAAEGGLRWAGFKPDRMATALRHGLSLLRGPRGRLEPVESGGGDRDLRVLVDFAHTDDALAKALQAVRSVKPAGSALWVVFGCGGDKDKSKRPRMGRVAVSLADRVVLTSDNPRTESPSAIIREILEGLEPDERREVIVHAEREQAIREAVRAAAPGDVLVIAGKGHELEQEVSDGFGGTVRRPFDDAAVAKSALAEWAARDSNVAQALG